MARLSSVIEESVRKDSEKVRGGQEDFQTIRQFYGVDTSLVVSGLLKYQRQIQHQTFKIPETTSAPDFINTRDKFGDGHR